MGLEQIGAILSVVVTGLIGLLTFLRGRRSDEALNIATNVKSTFDAQAQHIEALQEDIAIQRQWLHACEETCRNVRRDLDERNRRYTELEHELEELRRTAGVHDRTIARHETTLHEISRRGDADEGVWPNHDRRHPQEDPDEPADP